MRDHHVAPPRVGPAHSRRCRRRRAASRSSGGRDRGSWRGAPQRAVDAGHRQRAHQLGHHRAGPGGLQQLARASVHSERVRRARVPSRCRPPRPPRRPPKRSPSHCRIAAPRRLGRAEPRSRRPSVRKSCCAITLLLNLLMSRMTSASGGELDLEARRRRAVPRRRGLWPRSVPPISAHMRGRARARCRCAVRRMRPARLLAAGRRKDAGEADARGIGEVGLQRAAPVFARRRRPAAARASTCTPASGGSAPTCARCSRCASGVKVSSTERKFSSSASGAGVVGPQRLAVEVGGTLLGHDEGAAIENDVAADLAHTLLLDAAQQQPDALEHELRIARALDHQIALQDAAGDRPLQPDRRGPGPGRVRAGRARHRSSAASSATPDSRAGRAARPVAAAGAPTSWTMATRASGGILARSSAASTSAEPTRGAACTAKATTALAASSDFGGCGGASAR